MRGISNKVAYPIIVALMLLVGASWARAGEVMSFIVGTGLTYSSGTLTNSAPFVNHNLLSASHSDTLAASVSRGDVIVGNSTPAWSRLAIGTTGKVLHSDGTDVSWQSLAASDFPNDPVVAKTANYSVLSVDTRTFFTNTGASSEVDFTLPTAAAGLTYTFYVDAAQVVKVIAGASTTIQVGNSVSTSAGNITNSTQGGCITIKAISSTKWVTKNGTTSWSAQ